jgi:hypothetical protein
LTHDDTHSAEEAAIADTTVADTAVDRLMTATDALAGLARSRYVSVTTYRRNGTPVATPVWHAVGGGELYFWTSPDSGKIKRIRNDAKVLVTACGPFGRIAEGAPSATGTARLLDVAATDEARKLLARKHVSIRLIDLSRKLLRRGRSHQIAVAVSF